MKSGICLKLIAIALFVANPAAAQISSFTDFSADLDEINSNQAPGFLTGLLGDQSFLPPERTAVSGRLGIGSGSDSGDLISAVVGGQIQTTMWSDIVLGFGYSWLHAEFTTRTFTASAAFKPNPLKAQWLRCQTALSHQLYYRSGSYDAFHAEGASWPRNEADPLVLISDFSWTRFYTGLVAQKETWILRPQFSLGHLLTHYRYTGNEIESGSAPAPGDSIEKSGFSSVLVCGLGLGFDLEMVIPFVGLALNNGDGFIVARLTVPF